MANQPNGNEGQPERGAVSQSERKHEIAPIDLITILWKRKWIVIVMTLLAIVISVAYAVGSLLLSPDRSYLPNMYTSRALMRITSGNSSNNISLILPSSDLSSLAGLSGIPGLSSNANSNQQLAIALVTSQNMLDQINQKFNFAAHYNLKNSKPTIVRGAILKNLSTELDDISGILTVSFTDRDPTLAKNVVDEIVSVLSVRLAQLSGNKAQEQQTIIQRRLDSVDAAIRELQAKTQAPSSDKTAIQRELAIQIELATVLSQMNELAKLNIDYPEIFFQVIQQAEIPDMKSGPSRSRLIFIATVVSFFMSIIIAFIVQWSSNIIHAPDFITRFKSAKSKRK